MNDFSQRAGASVSLREILRVPWNEGGDFPGTWVAAPQTSLWTGAPPPRMRAPARVRSLPSGDIAVLPNDPAYSPDVPVVIHRYSGRGELRGVVRVAPPTVAHEAWHIADFLADTDGNIYLLETFDDHARTCSSLRKLDLSGVVVWARTSAFDADSLELAQLRNNFGQLLMDAGGGVYLAATGRRGMVARLDSASGETQVYAEWGEGTGEVFMDGAGRLYYVRYDPERRRRGWACYNPHTRQQEVHWGDERAYGLFDIPIGVDGQGRCYTAMGMRLACLSREAEPLWQEHVENIVVTGDAAYASESRPLDEGAEVVIRRWEGDGKYAEEIVLAVPSPPANERMRWRLVSRDNDGRFHLRGGAVPEEAALIYAPRGELEEITQPSLDSPATECRLQGGRTWSVDLEGAVYLPVLGPSAFHLLKLTVDAHGG